METESRRQITGKQIAREENKQEPFLQQLRWTLLWMVNQKQPGRRTRCKRDTNHFFWSEERQGGSPGLRSRWRWVRNSVHSNLDLHWICRTLFVQMIAMSKSPKTLAGGKGKVYTADILCNIWLFRKILVSREEGKERKLENPGRTVGGSSLAEEQSI
jgi:hypothetical protein